MSLDLLNLDAAALRSLFERQELTSVELVKQVLAQIERHDKKGARLNAMIAVAPEKELLGRAAELDEERRDGKVRSRLHGIPLLVKDAINTHPELGMRTTSGSFAMANARPRKSATVVEQLMEAGLLIIGKTNLNELCNSKGSRTMNGWSPVGGQTQSAYVEGGIKPEDGPMGHSNPCGSSTGSAVGVSAGYSPLALGTESEGSLVQPATRAALYTIKPTFGIISTEGSWPTSERLDTIGAMAKSVEDLADIMDIMLTEAAPKGLNGYRESLTKSFKGLTIGFVSTSNCCLPSGMCRSDESATQQMNRTYASSINTISDKGAKVLYPVSLPPITDLRVDGRPAIDLLIEHDYRDSIARYLAEMDSSETHNLDELIKFNEVHADVELPKEYPDQERLINASQHRPSEDLYARALSHMEQVARNGLDSIFEEKGLDLLAMSMDSQIATIAAASGYPIGTVPLGLLDHNGRPFGMGLMAPPGREDVILRLMSAFEAEFPKRMVPPGFVGTG